MIYLGIPRSTLAQGDSTFFNSLLAQSYCCYHDRYHHCFDDRGTLARGRSPSYNPPWARGRTAQRGCSAPAAGLRRGKPSHIYIVVIYNIKNTVYCAISRQT